MATLLPWCEARKCGLRLNRVPFFVQHQRWGVESTSSGRVTVPVGWLDAVWLLSLVKYKYEGVEYGLFSVERYCSDD